jgi:signal transduction histidine kinase
MTEEVKERLFQRFYRADPARTSGQGTGLGLAIAQEIVEMHDASIEVHSVPGRGTTVMVHFPPASDM